MTTEDRPGPDQGPGDGPEEQPRVTDKRRIDPDTFEVRDPLTQAAQALENAEEEVVLEGLVETQKLAAERLDQLQRVSADYVNLQNQYSAYVKRSKVEATAAYERGLASLAEGLIPVLDDIELARQHGDLTGPFASIAEKLEQILTHHGVERYGAAGEPFDPVVHEALMHGHSADVSAPTVQQVLQPGYRVSGRVLRAARVAVVEPDENDR